MNLLLDSFALIEFFKGTEKGRVIKDMIESADKILISVLCIYETHYVIEGKCSKADADKYIESLEAVYDIRDIDQSMVMKALELRRKFRLPTVDCLIYATARLNNASVVSGCPHFKKIDGEKDVIVV
ncbi:MAG: hypothetical protein MSIBF_02345 [Candidatus Altiarchaeales archaeon IMC4]|nr:MAG: hypothetical protein MSIBF_02345 [Candidatus Altiarchaeales archaeon IMC4]